MTSPPCSHLQVRAPRQRGAPRGALLQEDAPCEVLLGQRPVALCENRSEGRRPLFLSSHLTNVISTQRHTDLDLSNVDLLFKWPDNTQSVQEGEQGAKSF